MTKRNPLARRKESDPWAYVVPRDPGECWPWTGPKLITSGYGQVGGRPPQRDYAHRWMYEQTYGPIPAGLTVDHTCHNEDRDCPGGRGCPHRLCVNPAHLEAVTLAENSRRGLTSRRYCRNGGHEFTPENTYTPPSGERKCRECIRQNRRRRRTEEEKAAA